MQTCFKVCNDLNQIGKADMSNPKTPEEALSLINYQISKGKRPDSFEYGFPYIHHFKGSLKDHVKYINGLVP